MATWGYETATSTTVKTHQSVANRQPVYVMSRVVDYSSASIGATDVVQALLIPDNTVVLHAGIEVLTADSAGNSGTVALGSFSGIASGGFVAAAAPTTVGQMTSVTVPAGGFQAQGTDTLDTIDITGATGTINAVLRVWAIVADLDGLPNTQPVAPTTTAVLS